MRIGELAREAGTTPRTVRYYEEIGLLAESGERVAGSHREYGADDVERLRELLRLKDLLGLTLDELRVVMHGEAARAQRRREWQRPRIRPSGGGSWPRRGAHRRRCWRSWRRRKAELERFEGELNERRQRQMHLLEELVA